jgi:hypothetical protein
MKSNQRSGLCALALVAWLAVKVVLFVVLGRIDTARFVYAGF